MKEWTASVVIDDVIYEVVSDVAEADPSTGMEEEILPTSVFIKDSWFDLIDHLSEKTLERIQQKLLHKDLYA
jgi:hypothetical protein